MKKHVIVISLAFVVITGGLLVLFGLRWIDETVPSYRFLSGRNPIICLKNKVSNEDKRYIYSFEADFNVISSKANAELTAAGFVENPYVVGYLPASQSCRIYYLKEKFPRGPVWVYIYDNRRYVKLPDSEHYAIEEKDGWLTVDVVYWRGWRWPF